MERLKIDKQPSPNDFKLTCKPHGAARLAHMPECSQDIRAMRQIHRYVIFFVHPAWRTVDIGQPYTIVPDGSRHHAERYREPGPHADSHGLIASTAAQAYS